ncbi:uncharacterized protein IUM83_01810 [Phytophthora cinnamomi]|uniref:uncharacterized protein n=1 Tax=Phytophthora cinnamomi TaxID=4785 RepID=UPI0035595993|nr:hypothetical protein IUM83_01810 [Phytophthora cinnamomi]
MERSHVSTIGTEESKSTTAPTVNQRSAVTAKADKKAKVNLVMTGEDDYEAEVDDDQEAGMAAIPPPAKKRKTVVRRVTAATRQVKGGNATRAATDAKPFTRRFGETKC